jgi:gamma-glutamyltranspeptidase/glutathione hydrolase
MVFTKDGRPLIEGDRVVQRDLAATLRGIAASGPKAFYGGVTAAAIVRTVTERGGVMTRADLNDYRVVYRDPLVGSYRGRKVVTFPLPSSGGIVILQTLAMLERFDLAASGPDRR